ncbi:MAG: hypothetical protein LUI14_10580 [Lachnospiraceae bacterium]|nr:hypothetical protein [Lachnospiraceae bacterium]
MKRVSKENQVYCYTMEGSSCLFADERDKKHLLDLVEEVRQRDGWSLYAFCVMDDTAYFVIGSAQIDQAVRGLRSAILKQLEQSVYVQNRGNTSVKLSGHIKKLGTFVQVADCCREIHRIPLREGYVSSLEDYWWSSYPAYAGVLGGEYVSPRLLFLYNNDKNN